MGAEATAKELPRLGLADALELTLLIARKDPRRHPRVAARWLLRYLEEDDGSPEPQRRYSAGSDRGSNVEGRPSNRPARRPPGR
jgi:hypothetical protein